MIQLIFGDSAKGFKITAHADVLGLVESAENAHLRELGDSRKQYELQMFVSSLEYRIKSFQHVSMMVFQ